MKKDKEPLESKKTDTGRETRVLLERMHSDIQRIAEAHVVTNTRIAKIESAVANLPTKSEFNTMSMAVMQISRDVKDLKTEIKSMSGKVDENLLDHNKRITKLEEKVLA